MGQSKDIEKVPLSSQLEDFFATSEDGSAHWPKDLKEWVKLVFIPRPFGPGLWAELDPDERRVAAVQWDEDRALGESSERIIAWYDQLLRASSWWKRLSVSPVEAALLLCHQDPNDANGTPLSSTTNETRPEHYIELLRDFEEVSVLKPGHRRLKDWVSIARENGLKHHSWVTKYADAMNESAPEGSVKGSSSASGAAAPVEEEAAEAVGAAAGLTRREKQVRAIVAAAEKFGYSPLCIPEGGKKRLEKECQDSQHELFGAGKDPFKEAWQAAVKAKRIRMANHYRYSGQ